MVFPLSGIRVVEMTRDIAGPYCGMALADLGAEVLKVERPKTESYRSDPLWKAAKFVAYNRNKKSIAVDLDEDDGRLILFRILKTADVFLENFPPGVVDRIGFSYKDVSQINEKIIYCSIKRYLPGPYGDRDVEDTILESQAGYPQCIGTEMPKQPLTIDSPPLKLGVPIASLGAGEYAAIAIVGALFGRMKTNEGDYIKVGAFETAVNLLAPSTYSLDKEKKKQSAINYQLKNGEWLQGSYQHIGRSARYDRWKVFCEVFRVSKEDYEATDTQKKRNSLGSQGMREIISKYVSQFSLEEATKMIVENNIIAGTVVTVREILENDQLKLRLIPLTINPEVAMTSESKIVKQMMLPIQSKDYNSQATTHWNPAPKLGQDTIKVLQELGYTAHQIKDLKNREII